jgi:hypothetical protein
MLQMESIVINSMTEHDPFSMSLPLSVYLFLSSSLCVASSVFTHHSKEYDVD